MKLNQKKQINHPFPYKILKFYLGLLFLLLFSNSVQGLGYKKIINLSDYKISNNSDVTLIVKDLLSELKIGSFKLIFPKGRYHFTSKNAAGKELYITNHDNGFKKIAFNLSGLKNIEIDGQGSNFVFHGEIMPFLIADCENVTLRNFTIDWEIPFFIQGEVINTNPMEGWTELSMFKKGFSYVLQNASLKFPIAEGVKTFSSLGEGLAFDKQTKSPIYNANAYDMHRTSDVKVEQLPNGNVIVHEILKDYPPLNSILVFKGEMGENRYAPAFHSLNSKNVLVSNVTVFHAPGMGFLGEKSENISLFKFNVKLPEGSDRYVSAIADATHFANCKGKILLDSCVLENMLDDGTNVHGTYVEIDSIVNSHIVIAKLKHFQQAGFVFADKGDHVWFLVAPNSARSHKNCVANVQKINDTLMQIAFTSAFPKELKAGDLIENKTYNPQSFIMQNCTVRNHRARNVVLKTPGKVRIRHNYFQSMMAAILIRGEASMWFESGAVEDVIINNNYFENCVLGGGNQAVLHISPKLNSRFDSKSYFDKNIVFKNNTINTFDNKIIDAVRVENLTIKNNKIIQNADFPPFNTTDALFEIKNCKNVQLKNNVYKGNYKPTIGLDSLSRTSALIKGNSGF